MVDIIVILLVLLGASPSCQSFVVVVPYSSSSVSKRESVACHAVLLPDDGITPMMSTIMTTTSPSSVDSIISSSHNMLLSVVETFDGSQIVDPVVVSGVFWTSLKAKFVSLILGQLLATVVFGIVTTLAATQLSKLGDFMANTLQQQQQKSSSSLNGAGGRAANTGTFKKANEFNKAPVSMDVAKLALCILIDIIGTSSELIPILGEATDIVWAPIAGIVLRNLFYGSNILLVMEFTEEILPFSDILPLATLCWVLDTFFADSNAARALGIGSFAQQQQQRVVVDNDNDKDIIDVINVNVNRRDDEKLLPGGKRR